MAIYTSFRFMARTFRIHSTPQQGKCVSRLEKSLPRGETPWETCRARLWNKSPPCANVIALHVMSAWRARLSTLAVMGGEPQFIIPDRFWPVASASNELTHFKRRHSCLRLKSTPKIKCNREPGFLRRDGKGEGSPGRPGEPCLQGSYQSSGGGDELNRPCTQTQPVHPLQVCMHAWKHKYILYI